MPSPHLHIIGHELCPYVQRAVITLLELGMAYDRTDIDLDHKPDWLIGLTPTGKIPILVVNNDSVLFESNVIAEYLIELGPCSLLPVGALERGQHRAWIAYADQILDVIADIIYRAQTRKELDQAFGKISAMLDMLEMQLAIGGVFGGPEFRLIDVVYATVFRFFQVLGPLSHIDLCCERPKLKSWKASLADRPSVKSAVPDSFNTLLLQFIAGKQSFAATQLR